MNDLPQNIREALEKAQRVTSDHLATLVEFAYQQGFLDGAKEAMARAAGEN